MLRHYDDIGLFRPTRISDNGYRWYDPSTLPRLYRIIALRRSGLGLPEIARVVAAGADEAAALRVQLTALRDERARLDELILAVAEQVELLEGARIGDPEAFAADFHRERDAFAQRLDGQLSRGAARQLLDL